MDSTEASVLDEPYQIDRIDYVGKLRSPPYQHTFSPHLVALGLRGFDLIVLSLAFLTVAGTDTFRTASDTGPLIVGGCCASAIISYRLERGGRYRVEREASVISQTYNLLVSFAAGSLGFWLCLALLHRLSTDAAAFGIWMVITLVLLVGAVAISNRLLHKWRSAGALQLRVAVVGINGLSNSFIKQAHDDPHRRLRIVGVYTDGADDGWDCASSPQDAAPAGTVDDLIKRSRNDHINAIVLAVPLSDETRLERLRQSLRSVTAHVYATPDLIRFESYVERLCVLGPTPMVGVSRPPLTEWQQFQKTVFDRVAGAMILTLILPALLAVALAVRLDTPGPILFRQARIGFNNKIFTIYKFRTMVHDNDQASISGARQAQRDDPRVTRIGKWLRKLSLDELPQLFNVLKGEMSLVGPRPHPLHTRAADKLFHEAVADYEVRHRVRPGITGWAQVSGWRGETTTVRQIEQRVAHDLYYIDNWSLLLDLRIIFLTIVNEIRSKSAF